MLHAVLKAFSTLKVLFVKKDGGVQVLRVF